MKNNQIKSLKSNLDINEVFTKGRSVKNSEYVLKFVRNNQNSLNFAISPNKKIFKKAVLRNKVKRQVRSMVRSIDKIKSINLLIIVQPNYTKNTYLINKNSFITLFNKI